MTNRKTTKRALFTSTLALLMCVAMLIGTTFAWFTDTASTNVNKVQAGTLDVALEMKDAGGNWVTAEGQTLQFIRYSAAASSRAGATDESVPDSEILWEPGCTYDLPELRVRNNGNLAVKYKINITGIKGDAELNNAITWTIAYSSSETAVGAEKSLAVGASDVFTIKGHMDEAAGNEYQGLSIDGISITVSATQGTAEYDSFDNQYDTNATLPSFWDGTTTEDMTADADDVYHITNAAQFVKYIQAVGGNGAPAGTRYDTATVVLDCDIDLNGYTITRTGEAYEFSGSFDGQNHTVSNFTIKRTDGTLFTGLFGYLGEGGSVKNLTVKNATVQSNGALVGAIVPSVNETCVVDNCHAINCSVIASEQVGSVVGYVGPGGTVNDCTATDCNVYCAAGESDFFDDLYGIKKAAPVLGFNNGGTTNITDANATRVNVYFGTTPTFVSNATELRTALLAGGTVILNADITVSSWASVKVGTSSVYVPIANYITIDGAGHSISGLNCSLLAPNAARYITVKNLTIKDSDVVSASTGNESNSGAFLAYADNTVNKVIFDNCHTVNVNVTASGCAGALVGYCYTHATDGLPAAEVKFTNCTVKGGNVTTTDSEAAGIVGFLATESGTARLIENCKVENCTISGGTHKTGAIVGTVNNGGVLNINNCTFDSAYKVIGRNTYNGSSMATVNVDGTSVTY